MLQNVKVYIQGKEGYNTVDLNNIEDTEANFFKSNNLQVSMEQLNCGTFVVYAETGVEIDGLEEVLHVVPKGQTCQEAMKELKNMVLEVQKGEIK